MAGRKRSASKLTLIDGRGQLTLVEHALCPINKADSMQPNLVHRPKFFYTDKHRNRRSAEATIRAPLGLSGHDEFILYGILSLVFEQEEPTIDFRATPHYIMRRLGMINQHARRGGSQYQQFRAAIRRLSLTSYECQKFYHPIRGEHCYQNFGFFRLSLPLDDKSSRAYRFTIDPTLFEFCHVAGGWMAFDNDVFQSLGIGPRRLFLYLNKMFSRRMLQTGWIDIAHLAIHVMGYAASHDQANLTRKLKNAVQQLIKADIVATEGVQFQKGKIKLSRGSHYDRKVTARSRRTLEDSPLFEPLLAIGFKAEQIPSLLKKYRQQLMQEWIDITLAAKEKSGLGFFKKSPQAYFIDNIKKASLGQRTWPDWWHEHRKKEQIRADKQLQCFTDKPTPSEQRQAFVDYLNTEVKEEYVQTLKATMTQLLTEGCTSTEAKQKSIEHVQHHFKSKFLAQQTN